MLLPRATRGNTYKIINESTCQDKSLVRFAPTWRDNETRGCALFSFDRTRRVSIRGYEKSNLSLEPVGGNTAQKHKEINGTSVELVNATKHKRLSWAKMTAHEVISLGSIAEVAVVSFGVVQHAFTRRGST